MRNMEQEPEEYSLNNMPDLESLERFKLLLSDFVEHKRKYPRITKICGLCEHWCGIGDGNGGCDQQKTRAEIAFDSKGCKKWVANFEIVPYLGLFGLLGTIPKISKCRYYTPENYQNAQKGKWDCMFWEKDGCAYDTDGEEDNFKFTQDGDIICPDEGKKKNKEMGTYQDFNIKYRGTLKQLKATDFFESIQSEENQAEFLRQLKEAGIAKAWIGGGGNIILVLQAKKAGDEYEYITEEVEKPATELMDVIGIDELIKMQFPFKKGSNPKQPTKK